MEQVKRERGRPQGPETKRHQVLIEPDDAEWAKKQPGGLSETVRRLIKQARQKETKT